jgi:hypothetical protein
MFEKHSSFSVSEIPISTRVIILPAGDILAVYESASSFIFVITDVSGKVLSQYTVGADYGALFDINYFEGSLWLEFRDTAERYNEQLNIVSLSGEYGERLVFSAKRESYMNDFDYHKLFIYNGRLYLYLICFNRLHLYSVSNSDVVEIDVMEGGNWYIANNFSLCSMGRAIEVYRPDFSVLASLEYDGEINRLFADYSLSPEFFTFVLSDYNQEQTTLVTCHPDSQTIHLSYGEYSVANIGISGGRIWINPCSYDIGQDLGGYMVYDKFAMLQYSHVKLKNVPNSFGAFNPPFHRSSMIKPAVDGATIVTDSERFILFDHNGHVIQKIPIANAGYAAVSVDGRALAIIKSGAAESMYPTNGAEPVAIDYYIWNSAYDGGKVVELARYWDRES